MQSSGSAMRPPIFTAAMHPKSFVALDGADHLLSRAEDARYAAKSWLRGSADTCPLRTKRSRARPGR